MFMSLKQVLFQMVNIVACELGIHKAPLSDPNQVRGKEDVLKSGSESMMEMLTPISEYLWSCSALYIAWKYYSACWLQQ